MELIISYKKMLEELVAIMFPYVGLFSSPPKKVISSAFCVCGGVGIRMLYVCDMHKRLGFILGVLRNQMRSKRALVQQIILQAMNMLMA